MGMLCARLRLNRKERRERKGKAREYVKGGNVVVPKGESTSFNFGGMRGPSLFGGTGGLSTEKRDQDRTSYVENLWRFSQRQGQGMVRRA